MARRQDCPPTPHVALPFPPLLPEATVSSPPPSSSLVAGQPPQTPRGRPADRQAYGWQSCEWGPRGSPGPRCRAPTKESWLARHAGLPGSGRRRGPALAGVELGCGSSLRRGEGQGGTEGRRGRAWKAWATWPQAPRAEGGPGQGHSNRGPKTQPFASTGSVPLTHHTPVPGLVPRARAAGATQCGAEWLRVAGREARFEMTARPRLEDGGAGQGGDPSDVEGRLEIQSLLYLPHPHLMIPARAARGCTKGASPAAPTLSLDAGKVPGDPDMAAISRCEVGLVGVNGGHVEGGRQGGQGRPHTPPAQSPRMQLTFRR